MPVTVDELHDGALILLCQGTLWLCAHVFASGFRTHVLCTELNLCMTPWGLFVVLMLNAVGELSGFRLLLQWCGVGWQNVADKSKRDVRLASQTPQERFSLPQQTSSLAFEWATSMSTSYHLARFALMRSVVCIFFPSEANQTENYPQYRTIAARVGSTPEKTWKQRRLDVVALVMLTKPKFIRLSAVVRGSDGAVT